MADPLEKVITVYYRPGLKPNYSFKTDLRTGPRGELIFRNDNHPGFLLSYALDPATFGDLVFPNDKELALCSTVIVNGRDECPDGCGFWKGFKPIAVKKVGGENRVLVVRNTNGYLPKGKTEERFGYTLYVTTNPNGDPADFIAIDPIGSNHNGPRGFNLKRAAVATVLAVGVGALAYVALS
jgi:hypothetical protein